MKRVIRSSTTIQAAREVLMKSDDGLFEVVKSRGVGYKNTPWEGLDVISNGDADRFVVDIRLDSSNEDMNGPDEPVKFKYYDVEVAHGMSMKRETLEDTARYIEVLQSALDFAKKIKESDLLYKRR